MFGDDRAKFHSPLSQDAAILGIFAHVKMRFAFQHILPFAVDSDAGVNAQIRSYDIVSGDTDRFELSLESSLFLKLKKPIDREDRVRR